MQKTHKGAAKRLKVTANGKIKYKKSSLRHLLGHKDETRKRNLKQRGVLQDCDAKRAIKLLPFS
jgi:large subunit ribosomal protein L35